MRGERMADEVKGCMGDKRKNTGRIYGYFSKGGKQEESTRKRKSRRECEGKGDDGKGRLLLGRE